MSVHQITLKKRGAGRVARPSPIPLASGDTITFTAERNAATILCFGAETAALLSAESRVDVADGHSVSYTVGATASLSYPALVQAHGWPVPSHIPAAASTASPELALRDAAGKDFPGPPDDTVGDDPNTQNPPGS